MKASMGGYWRCGWVGCIGRGIIDIEGGCGFRLKGVCAYLIIRKGSAAFSLTLSILRSYSTRLGIH